MPGPGLRRRGGRRGAEGPQAGAHKRRGRGRPARGGAEEPGGGCCGADCNTWGGGGHGCTGKGRRGGPSERGRGATCAPRRVPRGARQGAGWGRRTPASRRLGLCGPSGDGGPLSGQEDGTADGDRGGWARGGRAPARGRRSAAGKPEPQGGGLGPRGDPGDGTKGGIDCGLRLGAQGRGGGGGPHPGDPREWGVLQSRLGESRWDSGGRSPHPGKGREGAEGGGTGAERQPGLGGI